MPILSPTSTYTNTRCISASVLLDEPHPSFVSLYWQLLRSRGSYLFYFPCPAATGTASAFATTIGSDSLPTARLLKIKEEIEFVVKIYVFKWKCTLP